MTTINSNITFDDGKITKCILEISGGKTYTVTLVKGNFNVEEGGIVSSSSTEASDGKENISAIVSDGKKNTTEASSDEASNSNAAGSDNNAYNTQEDLIKKLGGYGYTKQLQ